MIEASSPDTNEKEKSGITENQRDILKNRIETPENFPKITIICSAPDLAS